MYSIAIGSLAVVFGIVSAFFYRRKRQYEKLQEDILEEKPSDELGLQLMSDIASKVQDLSYKTQAFAIFSGLAAVAALFMFFYHKV